MRNSSKAHTAPARETPQLTVVKRPKTLDGHPRRTSLSPRVLKFDAVNNNKLNERIPNKMDVLRIVFKLTLLPEMRNQDKT